MEFFPFLHKLRAAFFMGRVEDAAIYWTYLNALGFFKPANAFRALVRVNDVDCFSFLDSFILAFRLTSPAVDAFVGDGVSHFLIEPPSFLLRSTAISSNLILVSGQHPVSLFSTKLPGELVSQSGNNMLRHHVVQTAF